MRIVLCDYDAAWAEAFSHLRTRLRRALGDAALTVEHVGSTAVPGLCAKPATDVLLVVADAADEAAYAPRLQACGFAFHLREPDWHQHRLFKLTSPAANLHVFSSGCPEIDRMLRFRDFLRRDADARRRYAATKRELAQKEWACTQAYAEAKSEVVESLLQAAKRST